MYVCMFMKQIHYDRNKSLNSVAPYAQIIRSMERLTYFDKIIFRL